MMIIRLTSVWIAVSAASLLSLVCHLLASELGAFLQSSGGELPLISKAFFPGAIAIYLFPLPLVIWAVVHSARHRNNSDLSLLIVTVTLSLSLIFIAIYFFAMALPFLPGTPRFLPE
jgi:hypothetical protein